MPSQSFVQAKQIGRQFEGLMRSVLESMGFEVIDSDKESYTIKKGCDCLVRIKNPDGTYRRNEQLRHSGPAGIEIR
jgi:hypothetical protein